MADVLSSSQRSRVMAAIRSRGNRATELRLATIFRQHRITGWRRHPKMTGNPDFAFSKIRLAIFVDGCFWHGCPKHGHKPKSNLAYWLPKLRRTLTRDKANVVALRKRGWTVVRIWQHELDFEKRTLYRYERAARLARTRRASNQR